MAPTLSPIEVDGATQRAEAQSKNSSRREAERRPGGAQAERSSIDPETIASAVESNRAVVLGTRQIEFAFDRDVNRVIVKVKDTETEEVVRQIPPEDYLHFLSRFQEAVGLLFDKTA